VIECWLPARFGVVKMAVESVSSVAVPILVPPSKKSTLPVALIPAGDAETRAVNVTGSSRLLGVPDDDTAVVVARLLTVIETGELKSGNTPLEEFRLNLKVPAVVSWLRNPSAQSTKTADDV
jgi:hypothetical protein